MRPGAAAPSSGQAWHALAGDPAAGSPMMSSARTSDQVNSSCHCKLNQRSMHSLYGGILLCKDTLIYSLLSKL